MRSGTNGRVIANYPLRSAILSEGRLGATPGDNGLVGCCVICEDVVNGTGSLGVARCGALCRSKVKVTYSQGLRNRNSKVQPNLLFWVASRSITICPRTMPASVRRTLTRRRSSFVIIGDNDMRSCRVVSRWL